MAEFRYDPHLNSTSITTDAGVVYTILWSVGDQDDLTHWSYTACPN